MPENKARKPKEQRPDKPTKNGHYMGLHYGFYYEDGKYKLAPCLTSIITAIIEERAGLNAFMSQLNAYFGEQYKRLAKRESQWWEETKREYGLEEKQFSYSDGWLTPVPSKTEPEHFTCVCCKKQVALGDDAIKHRAECEKDPLAIQFRQRERAR